MKGGNFPCPTCGDPTGVMDSRPRSGGVRRRRRCEDCTARFTTFETMSVPVDTGKRDAIVADMNALGKRILAYVKPQEWDEI